MGIVRLFRVCLIGFTALTGLGSTAWAQQASLPMLPEQDHAEWAAIGRLNIAGYRTRRACTGTLIAPRWVLTAAHCVLRHNGTAEPPGNIHFVAGWLRGNFIWHGRATSVHTHPDAARGPQADIALVKLHSAAPAALIAPIAVGPSPAGTDTPRAIIGYQSTRSAMLSAAFECLLTREIGRLRVLDCPVSPGLSGSPVLSPAARGWRVEAVVSARVMRGGRAQALAVVPGAWVSETRAQAGAVPHTSAAKP